jgi:lipopolysaccharide export system permease protein
MMLGPTFSLYVARRFLATMLAMFAGLLAVIVMVDFVEQMRKGSDFPNASAFNLLMISALKAPIFIDKAFPFACLFAAMLALTQLNQRMELVVARAAGVSAWQFLAPIAITAALVGGLSAAVYNPAAVWALEKSKDWEVHAFNRQARQHNAEVSGYWMKQDDGNGVAIINARIARNRGRDLSDIRILRLDPQGGIRERIDAPAMTFGGDLWIVRDAVVTTPDALSRTAPRYELPTNLTEDVIDGATATPDSVPFWQLRRAAHKATLSGNNPNPFLVQFWSLATLPLFLVAMVLIAATVSLRFIRFGQLTGLVLSGIMAGFLLYALTQLVTSLGSNGIAPPLAAALSPALVAILLGFGVLLNQEDG